MVREEIKHNLNQKTLESRHAMIEDRVLQIRRVSTKRAGGSSFHFSALSASGDHDGKISVAIAKSKENLTAIKKSKDRARRTMIEIPITKNGSIPHEIYIKNGAAILFMKPAPLGAGIIAGSSVRQVLELAGIKNISVKIMGTNNQISNAYTIIKALKLLKSKPSVTNTKEISE
ncbi:30S ribosomal protein S5 [candidate division WWE3 bacterium CG_4_9_14_0_2_um_filter_35_11]|uniref:Small ribosomal subunit protein uS5 n=1 Tax=candidate division WWE3 bacterium CG_4_9_14_0_2_um_filter_35_11 TaxID=1975077 RepID=A0A2M8EKV1_UNCKA|nr:MAG: 30S ribosomal protein S5 [candidate division WWE3 bacterium CG10_big_fil_rev_8_21_14_0_10_35_32]PJC23359.1 MAG: 30S ribosomal protein S5 [candidate division WWE3 bacterium CG_4_9_14_0_2_um_filter_35_11]